MAEPTSALGIVLKKSLDIDYTYWSDGLFDWKGEAKKLTDAYSELVRIHDAIEPGVRSEWVELAERYGKLVQEMQTLEQTKIGKTEEDRRKYTKQVNSLINEAKILQSDMQAEPGRLQLDKDYRNRVAHIDALLKYRDEQGLTKVQHFSNLKQAKEWIDQGSPSENQKKNIIKTVDECLKIIEGRKAEIEKERLAELEKQKREEDARQQKAKLEAAKDEERERQTLKAEQQDRERRAKAAPVKDLLDDALRAVDEEEKQYTALNKDIESKLGDPRLKTFEKILIQLQKNIEIGTREALAKTRQFKVLKEFNSGSQAALKQANADLAKMSVDTLETLERELNKVLEHVDTLAENRSSYEETLATADPDLLEKKEKDPKVRAYVYTDDLGAAQREVKDMVGILGGERRGRTSPNGKANHIHVGGNAQYNAIFDAGGPEGKVRLLGFVNGHMDRRASPVVLGEASRVESRTGGPFTEVEVDLKARTLIVVPH
jgi:hypothetical protein